MTRDEHLAAAEEYLRSAERNYLSSVNRATAEATIGLLHASLAAQAQPVVTITPQPGLADAVRAELDRLERKGVR